MISREIYLLLGSKSLIQDLVDERGRSRMADKDAAGNLVDYDLLLLRAEVLSGLVGFGAGNRLARDGILRSGVRDLMILGSLT